MDVVHLTIHWPSNERARLAYLVDNNVPIQATESGLGSISVSYQTTTASLHLLAFGVEFIGHAFEDLTAVASVNGGPARTLAEKDKAFNFWKGWGTTWL